MTLLVLSGLRNHLFPRLQLKISRGSLFCLFSMVTALMKLVVFFVLLNSIISSSSVSLLTPHTNYSLLTLVYLVHCNGLGWNNVTLLWNSQVQRCEERILLKNTCESGKNRSDPAQLFLHSRKAEPGQLIELSSLMMITHLVFLIQLKHWIFHRCQRMLQIQTVTC